MSAHAGVKKTYFVIFTALLFLTALTVAVAYLDLGALNTPVALLIATFKAGLVLFYFMHLKEEGELVKVFAAAGFFWLLIMLALTLNDFMTRRW